MTVTACLTEAHAQTHTLLSHTHRDRRSKTQLSQYTRTLAGSSLQNTYQCLKGLTIQVQEAFTSLQRLFEQGTFGLGGKFESKNLIRKQKKAGLYL